MSKTYLSALVIIIVGLFQLLGIDIATEKVQTTIEVILALISGIIILVERYKRGDITIVGVRK